MVKVAVLGAHGRMGTLACAAVEGAEDLQLVARIGSGDDREPAALADVVVDLTGPAAVLDAVRWAIDREVDIVVGTSGLDDAAVDEIRDRLGDDPRSAVLLVPNLSVGAVLMMRMAAQAAPYMESVEIVETHHAGKIDAPSGTARRTAELIDGVRRASQAPDIPDATTDELAGARGASVNGVRVHSRRLPGVVAEQEVLLGRTGETLAITHRTIDRRSFMPGLLASIAWAGDHPGLTVGLEHVLGLA